MTATSIPQLVSDEPERAPFPSGPRGLLVRARGFVSPLTTTAWYASPWVAARRQARHALAGIPAPSRSVAVLAGVVTDELCRAVFTVARRTPSAAELARIEAEADHAALLYARNGWLDDPAAYHPMPPTPEPLIEPVRVDLARVECLRFPTAFAPHSDEPGADRWARYTPNEIARAYLWRHADGPRPWLVCVHATEMGRPEIDRRLFRVQHLHEQLGLNVVLPVLPLHGARRPARGTGVQFPTLDVLDNVHGLAQAATDVRSVLAWIRTQEPTGVGLLGVSLGGYVTALVAGLEPPLDCVIAGMPVVDFPDLFRRNAPPELRDDPRYQRLGERAAVAHQVVAPLRFQPATPVGNRFVFAGLADRLADPVRHAGALWNHWGRPTAHWLHGSHVGHLLDRSIGRFVDDALTRTRLTAP